MEVNNKMSNETLYYTALERLNSYTSGSSDFENICRIIAKFMYPNYDFKIPEGGQGTKDGGYDGRDSTKKAKLACSIEKDYKNKIKSEVAKSEKNGDLEVMYFSNQIISEPDKLRIEEEIANKNIKVYISGIDELSKKIEEHFEYNHNNYDIELYDLLKLSFLKAGEYYRRGDAISIDDINIDKPYKKKIIINNRNSYNSHSEEKISNNPLLDFILLHLSNDSKYIFSNISICGIGYLGKSYLMKSTCHYLIKEFSDKNKYDKYKILPYIQFQELKDYSMGVIRDLVKNYIDPVFIFLDGLDELSEPRKIELDSEINNILRVNKHINFIISGRNSSFVDIEIFSNSFQLYLVKYIDDDDIELKKLIDEYKGTPLEDLLPIPMYRNYVLEKRISKNINANDLCDLLVRDNFKKDRERRDHSEKKSSRTTSEDIIDNILKNMSEFCYNLFINNKNIFSELELKNHFKNNEHFIFIIYSSIIDYQDENHISFVSNFYFEYFVSNALLTKKREIIIESFFLKDKLYIPRIDILMIFLNILKSKSMEEYKYILENIKKENIVNILLCEFDIILDEDRYNYFESIFSEYKKKNFRIYYGRFHQTYGALKNIDNMAQRMQLLLPNKYKIDAVNFLKKEVINFLNHPTKEHIISFGNAVILLMPSIKNLWAETEQAILKELSLKLIKFFIYDNLSQELNNTLSEGFIFDWYQDFKWTIDWDRNDWEQFYKKISDNFCNLFSEINDENEFIVKYNIFRISYKENRSLLFPIIRYAMKNKYMDGRGMASFVPEALTDDYETPVIKTDHRIDELKYLLKGIDISISEILDLLNYAIENNVYNLVKDSYDNTIKYLEDILYKNIHLIAEEDYDKFAKYYFGISEYNFDDRLFIEKERVSFISLAKFLIYEIINKKLYKWNTSFFLYRLINFTDIDYSIQHLNLICEKMPQNVYPKVIDCIYNNPKHILHNNKFIISEYQSLFKEEIKIKAEKDKKIEEIRMEMKSAEDRDISLIEDIDKMIEEIKKINDYLSNLEKNAKFDKLFSLHYERISNNFLYSGKNVNIPPIFSECAIKILEGFYRDNIYDINEIIKMLQEYLSKKENFYIYFYRYFIKKSPNVDSADIIENIKGDKNLIARITKSLTMDIQDKFTNKQIDYFENNGRLIPFFFYYKTLLNNSRQEWMQDEHILKLIVVPNPTVMNGQSRDLNLNWILELFPTITENQIIEYGLNIIDKIKNRISWMQVVKYFISYIQSIDKNELTDRIINFIINTTKLLFEITPFEHKDLEFQDIAYFWRKCEKNYIDEIFTKFTAQIVISTIKKDDKDIDCQYRKDVLLYCCSVADTNQRKRIINEIDSDIKDKTLSDEEKYEIQCFLASLGKEESIRFIIRTYLNGKEISSSYNNYPIGFINASNRVLGDYIDLFFYSTAKSSERRRILRNIAQAGIKQHLNENNFDIFKKRIEKEMKKQIKLSSGISEYYNEYLLQMEQSIFS